MRTTDAVIGHHGHAGAIVLAEARDMASEAEAAKVRDGLGIYEAIDHSLVGGNPYVDERASQWESQDSNGLKPWLVTFRDGSTYRVSRLLDQLADPNLPGGRYIVDGAGGISFVMPQAPMPGQLTYIGPGDGMIHVGTTVENALARIEAKLDKALEGK